MLERIARDHRSQRDAYIHTKNITYFTNQYEENSSLTGCSMNMQPYTQCESAST